MKRKWPRLRGLLGLALGLALGFVGGACGVKTPPYPAQEVLPAAPEHLTQEITSDGFLILTIEPPKKNMAGRPLKNLGGFRLEMAESTPDPDSCQGCPSRFQDAGFVPAGPAPPGLDTPPGPFEYRRRLETGRLYRFRVYSVSSRQRNHPEAWTQALIWFISPPPAVTGFTGRLEDRAVSLSWQPLRPDAGLASSGILAEGDAPARWSAEVERRLGSGPWKALPRPEGQSPGLTLTDYALAYDDEAGYRIRWLLEKEDTRIYGPYSPEYTVKVVDFTPPAPPARLSAAATAQGARLQWDDSPDPDLAGYRVYRRLGGQAGFILISSGLVRENTFLDREVEPETTAYYQVTAVDSSPSANESAPSPPALIRAARPMEPAPSRPAPPVIDEF